MATALLTRFSYPKVPGDQPESIIDVTGPDTYTPLVPGDLGATPPIFPTGGQRITAQDFGLQSLEFVTAMGSNDGKMFAIVIPELFITPPSPPLPTQLPDGTFTAVLLAWMAITGGQASGDLSDSTIRLFARGH